MSKLSSQLSPRGNFCLALAISLGIIGLMIKDGILITLAFSIFTLLICCYFIGRNNIAKIDASIMLPNRIHAHKKYQPYLTIHNHRKLLDAFSIKFTLVLPHETIIACHSPWLEAKSTSSNTYPISIPMRSTALEHAYKISSFFPLNLFYFSRKHALHHPITVYPRSITPIELLEHGSIGQCTIPLQNAIIQDIGEPRGLREWRQGDSAKHIHWPASARSLEQGKSILVREYDPPGQLPEHCTLLFHSFSADREMMREDTFERAISLLAGTIQHLRDLKIQVSICADFLGWNTIKADSKQQYYDFLALLAEAKRSIGTQKHELQQIIDQLPKNQQVITISDMPLEAWKPNLEIKENQLCIDIKQVRFPFKKTISAKQALAKIA